MKKVQCIKCSCGSVFAACWEPECYEGAEWQKNAREYIKEGCTVTLENSGEWKFENHKEDCERNNKKKSKKSILQASIF